MIITSLTSCNESSEESSVYIETTIPEVSSEPNILVVGCSQFSGQFSPFYAETSVDLDIVKMTSVKLLTFDREGIMIEEAINGETSSYNGYDFKYNGISDVNIIVSESGSVKYDFELRDDIMFSDGEILNADDVIFSIYVLSDPSYDGPAVFYTLPIEGMEEFRDGRADYIEGIERTGDYSFSIKMTNYNVSHLSRLSFTVAPMHYYGDIELYNYEQHQFGFPKGDLSSVKKKSSVPMGAGPYVFDRFEDGIVYFERNANFYKGLPNVPFVEFREINDSEKLSEILDGNIHISDPAFGNYTVNEILEANGGTLDGTVLKTYVYDNIGYGYIGICADTVKVGDEKASQESKYLRKAFATLFSVYRESAIEDYYGPGAEVINYPISGSSWAAPNIADEDYEIAFSKDINGNVIYSEDMDDHDKYAAALETAKNYFIAAGYVFDAEKGKFISAPQGAELSYKVTVHAEGKGDHPTYDIFLNAKNELSKIGITLIINDVQEAELLWDSLNEGECQIWAAAWNTDTVPNLYQIYHSDNVDSIKGSTGSNDYDIADVRLDSLIMKLYTSTDTEYHKSLYKECFDIVLDWGVELPIYQRKNAIVINAYSVDITSLGGNYTFGYTWIDDIHNLKMNKVTE